MKAKTSVSHSRRVIEEPRADPAFAREYLKAAVEEIDEPGGREALLVALRHIVEAQGAAWANSQRRRDCGARCCIAPFQSTGTLPSKRF